MNIIPRTFTMDIPIMGFTQSRVRQKDSKCTKELQLEMISGQYDMLMIYCVTNICNEYHIHFSPALHHLQQFHQSITLTAMTKLTVVTNAAPQPSTAYNFNHHQYHHPYHNHMSTPEACRGRRGGGRRLGKTAAQFMSRTKHEKILENQFKNRSQKESSLLIITQYLILTPSLKL